MNIIKTAVAASVLSVMSAPALAEVYVGLNYLAGELELADSVEADLPSLVIRAGYNLNDHISTELRGGFGVGQDDSVAMSGVDFELENLYSALVLIKAPSQSSIEPYLVAGFTRAEIKASTAFSNDTGHESDFSYGAGVNVDLTENLALNAEWIQYVSRGDVELSGPSIGLAMAF